MAQAVVGATEMLPHTTVGRRFTAERVVRLGDVDPAGWLRLDATARYLQDVAADDADDGGLESAWLVRRSLVVVEEPARVGERIELTTSCSGIGRSWAERRTTIVGAHGARVEAVSSWVQVDAATGRPTRLTDRFAALYGTACAGRAVSARLLLGRPPAEGRRLPWAVRRTDLDLFAHVNNAANWAFLEEAVGEFDSRRGAAEMEFVAPVEAGGDVEIRLNEGAVGDAWLVTAGGEVLSAARWTAHG